MLLDAAFNLLAVLAGLNRLYFARLELKRMRALVAKMELAPPRLSDRLESLFRLEPDPAATELGRLIEETRARVSAELPELELPLRFPTTRDAPATLVELDDEVAGRLGVLVPFRQRATRGPSGDGGLRFRTPR